MTKTETARQKKEARMQAELDRVQQMREFELETVRRAGGQGLICGIDEAGRGPLAGPVAAAAVILPEDLVLPYLNDSKKVTEKRREALYAQIREKAIAWAVVMVPPERIDEINILQATYEAMREAVSRLGVRPDVLVNDAVTIPGIDILQVPVIKGDSKCISIAAASILAKVERDAYMKEMDEKYPAYGFAGHKGYGTKAHCDAILENGPCPIHRRSFLTKLLTPSKSPAAADSPISANYPTPAKSPAPSRFPAPAGSRAPDSSSSLDSFPAPDSSLIPSSRETGSQREEQAALFLQRKGVRILEKGFHDRGGEIDIIGEDNGTIVFFEVKYRGSGQFGDPAEAVTTEKQRKLCHTALYYLQSTGCGTGIPARFDVIAMTDKSIRWIRNAFPFST